MTKTKKILAAAIAVVVALLVAADVAVSAYLLNYAIGRTGGGSDYEAEEPAFVEAEEARSHAEANRALQALRTAEFLEQVAGEQAQITAQDGTRLSGVAYMHESADAAPSPANSSAPSANVTTPEGNRWAIVIHGYGDTNQGGYVLDMAQRYYDAGFDVLTPDLRASGQSGGDYVGMGWLDRLDILDWVDWVLAQDPEARIAIHGVSMGAATAMMVAGEETPDAVVAFVEDCGYTSVWEVFASELSLRFGLPEFPLLHSASVLSSLMAGYSFEEASAIEAVARSEKPMLFIHGTADDFIPFDMMGRLYDAKVAGDKEALVSEGAGHVGAMYELGDAYWDAVLGFVDRRIES